MSDLIHQLTLGAGLNTEKKVLSYDFIHEKAPDIEPIQGISPIILRFNPNVWGISLPKFKFCNDFHLDMYEVKFYCAK